MRDDIIFEARTPDGKKEWKAYVNGEIEGFPDNVIIFNHAVVKLQYAIGLIKQSRASGLITADEAKILGVDRPLTRLSSKPKG